VRHSAAQPSASSSGRVAMLGRAAARRRRSAAWRGPTRGETRASHSKARSRAPISTARGLCCPLGDELSAELPLREQSIVSRTEDVKIVDGLAAPARPRLFVVDLSEPRRGAALPVATHERAAQPASRRDLPLYVVGDVLANASLKSPAFQASRLRTSATTGRLCLGKALLLDSRDEHVQRHAQSRLDLELGFPRSRFE
jgi:hypothetical protein